MCFLVGVHVWVYFLVGVHVWVCFLVGVHVWVCFLVGVHVWVFTCRCTCVTVVSVGDALRHGTTSDLMSSCFAGRS